MLRLPASSRMRLAIMLSCTSLVPPSIELALVRSQARAAAPSCERSPSHSSASAAADGHHQLRAALVELGAVVLEHRRTAPGAPARPWPASPTRSISARNAASSISKRGDVGAQQRVVQAALLVARRAVGAPCWPSGRGADAVADARRSSRARASSRYLAMSQPPLSLPTRLAPSAPARRRRRSRRTASCPRSAGSAWSMTPGVAMSNSRKLMPSCFLAAVSVRTRQKIQSALSAYAGPDLLAVDDEVVALVLGARSAATARSEPALGSE